MSQFVANRIKDKLFFSFFVVGHGQSDGDLIHARIKQDAGKQSILCQEEWINPI